MKTNKKNKGFSLVELLAAMAISAVVMMMTTSVIVNAYNNYNNNNSKAKIQNEISQAMNKIGDTIMEAKAWNMSDSANVKTSTEDSGAYVDAVGKTLSFNSGDKKIYITHQTALPADKKPYIIAENVTDFSMEIDDSCKSYDPDDGSFNGYKNPIKVNVYIKIEYRNKKIDYTQSYYIRDKLTTVTVEGNTYTVE